MTILKQTWDYKLQLWVISFTVDDHIEEVVAPKLHDAVRLINRIWMGELL